MDNGPRIVAVPVFNAQPLHELPVAAGHAVAVYRCGDTLAADLLNVRHPAPVQGLSVGGLQAFGNGMGGGAFRQGGVLQQPLLRQGIVVDRRHLENASGQGAGFVKDHRIHIGQGL